jgi:signal transduction histidine kinase
MASHEFRTPLNIIDGHAQRLIRHKSAVDASEIEMRTGEIRAAVSRMTHLIDTVLDANRLMDGKIQLYLQPSDIDLAVLLGDVCRQHQEISPHARIQTSVRPASLPLFGDYKLIFQAFSNIIGNAIKYSESKYPIIVSAEKKELEILVTVSDKGIGIPSSDVSRLFDRYYRGSNVSGIIGTGIGLYLVKMVIDHHQGTIDVSSIEGAGTQITVRLPCQLPAPRTAARIAETAILD